MALRKVLLGQNCKYYYPLKKIISVFFNKEHVKWTRSLLLSLGHLCMRETGVLGVLKSNPTGNFG